jgi:hypothetical protein
MADFPPAVRAYFDAPSHADIQTLGAIFSADAHVHDERQDYVGLEAIRAWRIDTQAKTPFVARPLESRHVDDALVVSVEVSGAFPGSPVRLDHRFVLVDGRIASLDIR